MVDSNIRLKTFRTYDDREDDVFNTWMEENADKVVIKNIKELAVREYVRILVWYTTVKKED